MSDPEADSVGPTKLSRRNLLKLGAAAAAGAALSGIPLPSFSEHAQAESTTPNEKAFDVEILGSVENPVTREQEYQYRSEVNNRLEGTPCTDGDSIRVTYAVYPEAYVAFPQNYGYASFEEFITEHLTEFHMMLFNAGFRNPYTQKPVPLQMTRLIIMEDAEDFILPTSFNKLYMFANYEDSYGIGGSNWLSRNYRPETEGYIRKRADGILINDGLIHELAHQMMTIPDIYAQDFKGQDDPFLQDIHPVVRDYISREINASQGGSLMGGVRPRMDPYAVWLLMNRFVESESQIWNRNRYKEADTYRTRVAAGDMLEISVLNEALPPGIRSVDVYRTTAKDSAPEVPDSEARMQMMIENHQHDAAQVAVASDQKKLIPLQSNAPWNPEESLTFRINHPYADRVGSQDPTDIFIEPEDSLCAMIFRDAQGKALAIRYFPVTDLTVGQSFDKKHHKRTQRLGMHIRDFNTNFEGVDTNIGKSWQELDTRIVYYDGKPFCENAETTCMPLDPPTDHPPASVDPSIPPDLGPPKKSEPDPVILSNHTAFIPSVKK